MRRLPPRTTLTDTLFPYTTLFRSDVLLARGQRGRFGIAADREIGTELALAGLAVDRARDLAVDQHDALLALAHAGKELLAHEGFGPPLPQQLDERRAGGAGLVDAEHRLAAVALQRRDDQRAGAPLGIRRRGQ